MGILFLPGNEYNKRVLGVGSFIITLRPVRQQYTSITKRQVVEVLPNGHRNRRFIRDGSSGHPLRLSHSS